MLGLTPYENKRFDFFNLFNDWDKDFFGSSSTAVKGFRTDIQDNKDEYILEAELPGFAKDDINIEINKDYLTISAERRNTNEEKDKDGRFIRRERSYGSFQRSFNISNVKSEEINAEYKNGILKVLLPKKEETQPSSRRLEIK